MRGLIIAFCAFFAYIANSMIARVDAAVYGVHAIIIAFQRILEKLPH